MGVESLTKVTLLLPRSELNDCLRSLFKFGWFHPEQPESSVSDPYLSELNGRAFKLFANLDDLVKKLGIALEPNVIEVLKKGYKIEKEVKTARDWHDLIEKLEVEATPIIEHLSSILDDATRIRKKVSDYEALKAALYTIQQFSIDLELFSRLKRFHAVFAVAATKDVAEIRRSLTDVVVIECPLTKNNSAILIVGVKSDADKVDKVLRSFEVKPFLIPQDLPQNPASAYKVVVERLAEAERSLAECESKLEAVKVESSTKLLSLREAAQIAYTTLSKLRKAGDLKRFAVIEGYLPLRNLEEFKQMYPSYLIFFEEEHSNPPTLMSNKRPIKPFENITLTQGAPKSGDVDPTPLIAFIFPIFYGMMFGDFGQGLLLFILGLMLKIRGSPSLKYWGEIIMAAGAAATVVGALVGEGFGLELGNLPAVGDFFKRIQIIHLVEHGGFNTEAVGTILSVAILIGAIHIFIGLVLDVIKGFRAESKVELYTLKIPSLLLYVFGVGFSFSFIASGYSFAEVLTSNNRVPIISDILGFTVTASALSSVTLPVTVAAAAWIVIGKPLEGILAKGHGEKESPFMGLIFGIVEFLLRLVEFLANTISYARLGILLLVHAALMFAVTMTLSLGLMGLPIWIIGNLGVVALEGLIVYIQDIRLHLYEWFTKFYEGTGRPFTKIAPETTYVKIELES
ncbi:MAG: V-type ATPase 116kDa subunit family protein [Nitrososphaerales archaeon]